MAIYAYLRVSTDRQDVANQRYGLFEYAHRYGLGTLQFVEETTSSRLAWRERAVGQLLTETVQAGDVVLFAEISRMARSTLQVLEMLEQCMTRGVTVHIAKQQMVLNGAMQSRIAAIVLGLAAEIEREFMSLRTTEALAKRRAAGKPLGRPQGSLAPR
jgi:DNA invertase Pin-like site-specific DNA recombinase